MTTPNDPSPWRQEMAHVMDDDDFRRELRQALHLPPDASDYRILAEAATGYHFYLLNRPAPGTESDT